MHMLSSQCMQNLFVFLTITKSQEYYGIIHHNMLFVHEKLFFREFSFLKNHILKHMNESAVLVLTKFFGITLYFSMMTVVEFHSEVGKIQKTFTS